MKNYNDLKPQFAHLTFKSQDELGKWLNEVAVIKISLADQGQDLLEIWIAESGEIVHTNMQAEIWCGSFVDIEKSREAKAVYMFSDVFPKGKVMYKLYIDEILDLKTPVAS